MRDRINRELGRARARTHALLEGLSDADLVRPHSPLMSPLVWDLGHIANYEEYWLAGRLGGMPPISAALNDMYDSLRHPRAERAHLPLPLPSETLAYAAEVRARVKGLLDRPESLDPENPLTCGGFVWGMVIQHEQQHVETMLATLQLMWAGRARPWRRGGARPEGRAPLATEVLVEGGTFVMGADRGGWRYDNESPAHSVDLPAFWIDAAPVTNAAYAAFTDGGGYREARFWSPAGWSWRARENATHPLFWRKRSDGGWNRNHFGKEEPVPPDEPVEHVSWFEADAYARWAGKRLPTEAEWEKAASFDHRGGKRAFPWSEDEENDEVVAAGTVARANLGGGLLGPAPVGAYPKGASPWGALQMMGDVWEWTASDFRPYPGFLAFPYREYSEVFFGPEYKVLRGGSWATDAVAIRTTFRNWDLPQRRQVFSGFRCARDG